MGGMAKFANFNYNCYVKLYKSLLLILLVVGILNSCKKDDGVGNNSYLEDTTLNLPMVTTLNPIVTDSTIFFSGEVIFTDGENSTKRGVCWSENPNPTTNDQFYMDTVTGMGSYSMNVISKLMPRAKYYVKAFAENSVGKVYGNEIEFTGMLNPYGAQINSNGCLECDKYNIGDTFILNETEFIVANRDMLVEALEKGNDVTKFCTSKIINLNRLFYGLEFFNQDIGNWDVSNVTDMGELFALTRAFNRDISKWDVSNVKDMSKLFYGSYSFNQDISSWDVGNVKYMNNMFTQNEVFNQDIGSWNVSNVTDMEYMYYDAQAFNQDLSKWCVKNLTSIPESFSTLSALTSENHPVWGTCP